MNKKLIALLSTLAAISLAGCAPCGSTACRPTPGDFAPLSWSPPPSQKIVAVGYGTIGTFNAQYSTGQQKLLAMRAAKVDAYRALAEQVNGFRLWGNTAVSSFTTQSDNVRTYVDAVLRNARMVNMTPVGDGNFEATIELELTSAFFGCVTGAVAPCPVPPLAAADAGCMTAGCVQPGAYYNTAQ